MSANESRDAAIVEFAGVIKTLSVPTRLMLLNRIIEGVQCNCELGKSLSLAPNLVSHHLSVLCDAGFIKAEHDQHDARWIYYSVNQEFIARLKIYFNEFFDEERIKPCLSTCGPRLTEGN